MCLFMEPRGIKRRIFESVYKIVYTSRLCVSEILQLLKHNGLVFRNKHTIFKYQFKGFS